MALTWLHLQLAFPLPVLLFFVICSVPIIEGPHANDIEACIAYALSGKIKHNFYACDPLGHHKL
jgi:hypothetical protein